MLLEGVGWEVWVSKIGFDGVWLELPKMLLVFCPCWPCPPNRLLAGELFCWFPKILLVEGAVAFKFPNILDVGADCTADPKTFVGPDAGCEFPNMLLAGFSAAGVGPKLIP